MDSLKHCLISLKGMFDSVVLEFPCILKGLL